MCGIVGYMGPQQAAPILIKGLHRLEYRGYDSAGIALINDNGDLSVYPPYIGSQVLFRSPVTGFTTPTRTLIPP